jgi:hypothetical protein
MNSASAIAAISNFATGGISQRWPVPGFPYRSFFAVDPGLSRRFPRCARRFSLPL